MQEENKGEDLLTPNGSIEGHEATKQHAYSKIEDYPLTEKTTYEHDLGPTSGFKTSSKAGYPSSNINEKLKAPHMIVVEEEESPIVQDGEENRGR